MMTSIRVDFRRLLGFIFVLYVFTFGVWIQLFGISNPYRSLIYSISLLGLPAFLAFGLTSKKHIHYLIVFVFQWVFFIALFLFKGNGSFLHLYDYIFVQLYVILFLLLINNKNNTSLIFTFLILFGTINSLFSIYEFFKGVPILSIRDVHTLTLGGIGSIRTCGLIGSSLINGCLCGVSSLIILSRLLNAKKNKLWFLMLFAISAFALITTLSRGPIVATAISSILYGFLRNNSRSKTSKYLLFALIVFLGLIGISVLLSLNSNNVIIVRLQNIFNWTSESGNVSRISIWKRVLNTLSGNYLFGMGIGTLNQYGILVTESGVLFILFETGIAGTIVYFLPFIIILLNGFKAVKRKKDPIVLLAICICLLLYIENIVLQVLTSLIVQLVFGLCNAIILSEDNEKNICGIKNEN